MRDTREGLLEEGTLGLTLQGGMWDKAHMEEGGSQYPVSGNDSSPPRPMLLANKNDNCKVTVGTFISVKVTPPLLSPLRGISQCLTSSASLLA